MGKKYDFGEVIDRRGTASLKYDFGIERKNREDLLPLWVADMDFRIPQEVVTALQDRVSHGIFGYTDIKENYKNSVCKWFLEKHHWEVDGEWLTATPGVVYAISVAIRAFTEKGDSVLVQQPVYYPFSECIIDNDRHLVNSQLIYENGHYRIDFEDFERKIKENQVKLFLLCSPHNPVGRVWTREELIQIGEICLKYGVTVFADEIHCDFVYPGYWHVPFASIRPEFAQIAVVGTSPSKTFNLAGLQISNIFIPNDELRRKFRKVNAATGYSQPNTLGLVACQAAYDQGEEWYLALLEYLNENLKFVREFVRERLPQLKLVEPEGTYLIWLDCSGLGITPEELQKLMTDRAGLWLDDGVIFGEETALFERINIACPRSVLKEALERIENAISIQIKGEDK